MDRRTLLKAAGSAAGLAALGTASLGAVERASKDKSKIRFTNSRFYDTDGQFDVEKAKDAIVALCKYHGYPLFPEFREKLWVSDYGTGRFTDLGLAAYAFVNEEDDRFMVMDLFLLPGQMLPEHWHVEGEGNPAKREGWVVRWGAAYIGGIGEPNMPEGLVIPKCHCGGTVSSKHVVYATPGKFVKLARVLTKHWQLAGPEGAIVTEAANVHTNSAVRHSDPGVNKHFLGD